MKKSKPLKRNDAHSLSKKTPWGKAQDVTEIADGIISFSTASHGGYFLNAARNAHVPLTLKENTFGQLGLKGWYEEDCDWAIVVYVFPEFFNDERYAAAISSLRKNHGEMLKHAK